MPAAAVLMLIAAAAACCTAIASDSDADSEPEDYGSFWSYAITVQYNPPEGSAPADTVTYDFGDGTETVTGNYEVVKHVYAAKGDYTITQTATNTVGSVTAQWIVHILGNPTVTYVYGHDLEDKVVTQSNYALAPEGVEVPEIDGYTFMGWYTDAGLTQSADMSAPVTEPITLYAKWSEDAHPETVTVTIASPDAPLSRATPSPSEAPSRRPMSRRISPRAARSSPGSSPIRSSLTSSISPRECPPTRPSTPSTPTSRTG
ncbi:InlB B-repeat-containing protein [Candidatus Methanomethylophilus sp. 1R26]|uniref:InlB B-repeat-containing protein n=1 Tax=Candidatus Methanomethylophilus sp. 1R26 TaxID=1769296 RepID=UPI00138F557C|nr:InlB B-repeat-containing protein [Candidatus Methanomethylophilus sp. 1R26]